MVWVWSWKIITVIVVKVAGIGFPFTGAWAHVYAERHWDSRDFTDSVPVAQRIEHSPSKRSVVGSIPTGHVLNFAV